MTGAQDHRLPRRRHGLFAWTRLDALSVLAALAHVAFVVWVVAGFAHRPWWANLLCGAVFAYAASWNINSVAHNFIHTPYFRWRPLNDAFSLLESLALFTPQRFYAWVHLRHHEGNSDRPDPGGETRDWLSIYRHGQGGEPEAVWSYVAKGVFRDDAGDIYRALQAKRPRDAVFGRIEIGAIAVYLLALALVDWRAVLFLVPFYFVGEALSQLNGYYEHYRGNPDEPMAWGVSTYAPLYNLVWFNNGHHAEHHYRPAVHWSRLPALRRSISREQEARGVHVIGPPHALGFLARGNRRRSASAREGLA
ncbi:MAG: fatty acid desaturase family protein [Phenylobacterium sp.]